MTRPAQPPDGPAPPATLPSGPPAGPPAGPPVVWLAEAAGLDPGQVGHKAANLARLAAAGLPVPAGVVLPADAFASPDRLAAALPGVAARLGGDRFAVRSSASAEDLPEASYAGIYDSLLDVTADQLSDAIRRVRASGRGGRVAAYQRRSGAGRTGPAGSPAEGMAVLIQRMLHPDAAGVALTANPITGARNETVITVVAGPGEPLVAGQAGGDEWVVRGGRAYRTRQSVQAIDAGTAIELAALARRVEAGFGRPQDLEWAIEDGTIWLLQARPMTALPEPVAWTAPGPGLWLRSFRLGEWLPDPVTPLFADWLLPAIEAGFRRGMRTTAGVALPFASATVNGWYYTRPTPEPRAVLPAVIATRGRVLRFAWAALIAPFLRPVAADRLLGALARQWREELLPRYRYLVAAGEREAGTGADHLAATRGALSALAGVAGEHLWSLAVVGGAAWKLEAALARFHRRHLTRGRDPDPGEVQRLLTGLPGTRPDLPPHAVHSLDPYHPTAGDLGWREEQAGGQAQHRRLAAAREAATAECLAALAATPHRQAGFAALLRVAQRYAALREEQARSLTLGWPLLRRRLLGLGQALVDAGVVDQADDVFFLTGAELERELELELDRRSPLGRVTAARRAAWTRQRRLAAPLTLGTAPWPLAGLLHAGQAPTGPRGAPAGSLVGAPASPGTATGIVRIVTDPTDLDAFRPGEVLVARATAPAWTPLFAKAAAVVTDAGTLAAHASLVAREYAIPAVVGTGRATTTLRTGQLVTVDGTAGQVHPRS